MGEEIAISLKNVSKCFKRYGRPVDRLHELLLPGKVRADTFWALRDINLEIPQGQTVGIIGRNGSGKSTLLQIIAGTLTPTSGEVQVKGRVSALLELGSGFNPEFTGRQNVFFNGQLLGLTQKEIEDKFDEIAGFADIGDFIEQPVKTYSSGMFVRLAFAVAVNVNPEILIVDEALAVGDVVFQHRCLRRIRTLMDSGVTTLFVSHDSGAIKNLCNSAVMIHDGQIYTSGLPNAIIIEYMKLMTELELGLLNGINDHPDEYNNDEIIQKQKDVNNNQPSKSHIKTTRRGNRKALIAEINLLNQYGEYPGEPPLFGFNEKISLIIHIHVYQPLESCIVGFLVCDKNGNEILGGNTFEENYPIRKLDAGEDLQIKFEFRLPLRSGSYSLTVAGTEKYTDINFDWIDNAVVFQVLPPPTGKGIYSLVDLPVDVNITRNKSLLPNQR